MRRGGGRFDVKRNPGRLFRVTAGAVTVDVLGTRFSVRHEGDEVHVSVERGRVRVRSPRGEQVLGEGEASAFPSARLARRLCRAAGAAAGARGSAVARGHTRAAAGDHGRPAATAADGAVAVGRRCARGRGARCTRRAVARGRRRALERPPQRSGAPPRTHPQALRRRSRRSSPPSRSAGSTSISCTSRTRRTALRPRTRAGAQRTARRGRALPSDRMRRQQRRLRHGPCARPRVLAALSDRLARPQRAAHPGARVKLLPALLVLLVATPVLAPASRSRSIPRGLSAGGARPRREDCGARAARLGRAGARGRDPRDRELRR